jgi:oxygen-dependent protoporphyrinogen oxidase
MASAPGWHQAGGDSGAGAPAGCWLLMAHPPAPRCPTCHVSVALAWPRARIAHPLAGSGFVVAREHSGLRITACTWVSSKWQDRAPRDMALLRAFLGGASDPAAVELADDALVEIARATGERPGSVRAPALPCSWIQAGAQRRRHASSGARRRAAATYLAVVAGCGFHDQRAGNARRAAGEAASLIE